MGSLVHQSYSEYTVVTIPRQISITGGEIDFQVQATEWQLEPFYNNGHTEMRFTSFEASEWSSTQTIPFDETAFTTSPYTLPPYTLPSQNSTTPPDLTTKHTKDETS